MPSRLVWQRICMTPPGLKSFANLLPQGFTSAVFHWTFQDPWPGASISGIPEGSDRTVRGEIPGVIASDAIQPWRLNNILASHRGHPPSRDLNCSSEELPRPWWSGRAVCKRPELTCARRYG